MTLKEVICINVGQAGLQLTNAAWELLCVEHGIEANGRMRIDDDVNECFRTFFEQVPSGNYVPRSINIDLEPTVIDEMRTGSYRQLWHPDNLISSCEDAANNFARGNLSIGKSVIDRFMKQLRKGVNNCNGLQGFFIMNSYGGGTGSGLSTLILEHIDIDYSKVPKFQMCIFPSSQLSTAVVEPYNALLTSTKTISHTDVVTVFDNEALYDICEKRLNICRPIYNNLNRIISQIFSNMTVSIRYNSHLQHDLVQMQTNLIPFPRIHFPMINYAPVFDTSRAEHETLNVLELTRELFDEQNQLVKCDLKMGKYMSCCLQYRGCVTPREVSYAIADIKRRNDIKFVDWCPTGFKIGINPLPPTIIPASHLSRTDASVTMFFNSTAIGQTWTRLCKKFDLLFDKRAFIHWFVGEGMEEGEFVECREDLAQLITDYEEVGQNTDDDQANQSMAYPYNTHGRYSDENPGHGYSLIETEQ